MCLAPITIDNPRYKQGSVGLNYLFNTVDSKIQVPCGTCPQCTSLRQSFFLQRVQMESLRSHLFMFTLTYNDESLVYTDAGEYQIAYPDFSDIQKMFKRLRKQGYKFRFSYVSEYGSKRHRPHYHGIFALDKSLGDPRSLEVKFSRLFRKEWRRNYGNSFSPDYRPLFTPVLKNCRCTTFDFHYIEPIRGHDNDVSFYVSKYITKYDKWIRSLLLKILQDTSLSDEETSYLVKCLKPRCNISKDFGDWKYPDILSYIKRCALRESNYKYPQFFDINTGRSMPMSPYYAKRVIGFHHMFNRFLASDSFDLDSTTFDVFDTVLDYSIQADSSKQQFNEFEKKLEKLFKRLDL